MKQTFVKSGFSKLRKFIKTTFVFLVFLTFFFSCSPNREFAPKDCEGLKAQGIIDSFPYLFRPGSAEWKNLKSHSEMIAAVTVPENELQNMCTQGLVYTCVYCPLFIDLFACNHLRDCFLSLTENVNSFGELITRSDAGTELFNYYRTFFDTTKTTAKDIDVQFKIYGVETFFGQQEFLSKLNEQELNDLLSDVYGKLKYKQENNVTGMSITSSRYLLANILYHNLQYEPLVKLIDRNDMGWFINSQMWLVNQPVDSVDYFVGKYLNNPDLEASLSNEDNNCGEGDIVSPKANSKILFISRRIENSADWNLFLMNFDGSHQVKLTDLTVRCEKVVVSHSGQTALFVHYSDDNFYELYSINIDGTNLTLIDKAKRYCGSPDWSTDDSKIIYSKSRNESTDERDLILLDVYTNNKQTLTNTDNNIFGRFSIDNKIAFWRQNNTANNIYLMDIDGSNKRLIIPDAACPVWSPGGKRIAYISKGEINSPQIFISCSDGSNPKQLTSSFLRSPDSGFPNFGNDSPQWTPDGKKIVYESHANDGLPEIYIMSSDGSSQMRLTDTDRRNENPTVSADGNLIYFTSNRDLSYSFDIFVMTIDGKNQNPLSKYNGDDGFPVIVTK